MSRWRKRPNEVEAFLWTSGPDQTEDPEWFQEAVKTGKANIQTYLTLKPQMRVKTGGGDIIINPPMWIVQDVRGEIYPCAVDVFEQTYDEVEQKTPPGILPMHVPSSLPENAPVLVNKQTADMLEGTEARKGVAVYDDEMASALLSSLGAGSRVYVEYERE